MRRIRTTSKEFSNVCVSIVSKQTEHYCMSHPVLSQSLTVGDQSIGRSGGEGEAEPKDPEREQHLRCKTVHIHHCLKAKPTTSDGGVGQGEQEQGAVRKNGHSGVENGFKRRMQSESLEMSLGTPIYDVYMGRGREIPKKQMTSLIGCISVTVTWREKVQKVNNFCRHYMHMPPSPELIMGSLAPSFFKLHFGELCSMTASH